MSLMKSLHVVLELKTVVTAERYSMYHVLSRIECALCIYLFYFTRLQNSLPSEAWVRFRDSQSSCAGSAVVCTLLRATHNKRSLHSLLQSNALLQHTSIHCTHSRSIELTQICSPLLLSSWSSALPLASSRSLQRSHRFAHPHSLGSRGFLLTDNT